MGFQVLGTALNIYGQISQARSIKQETRYSERIEEIGAGQSEATKKFNIDRIRRDKNRFLARQTVSYAKAGVRLEGSPLDVMADTAAEFEKDVIAEEIGAKSREAKRGLRKASYRQTARAASGRAFSNIGSTILAQTSNYVGNYFGPRRT